MARDVAVIGGTGMLGAMVVGVFAAQADVSVVATSRGGHEAIFPALPNVSWRHLDARRASVTDCVDAIKGAHWVVNCIGITKPLIADDNRDQIERAIEVNAVFPHRLAMAALQTGAKVIQIATDCVFSGSKGAYGESDPHDALDVYGKSKSLGEVKGENFYNVRSSIIGPEPKDYKFLIEWLLGQKSRSSVNGFVNHEWNGVTTLQFARVAAGIVMNDLRLPNLHHLCPAGRLTKADMLHAIARAYGREDIQINDVTAAYTIDRTLTTGDAQLNAALWRAAGYETIPDVVQMINEVQDYKASFDRHAVARDERRSRAR